MSWYEQLLRRAEAAFVHGDINGALALFSQAEQRALAEGDRERADRAFCNRATVLIDLERGDACIARLKTILLRSESPLTRWMASYSTAMAYYAGNDFTAAESYLQRASRLAAVLDDPVRGAATANLAGNVAIHRSDFRRAEQSYREALATYERLDGYHRLMAAQVRDNLGYVFMCTGRTNAGINACETARDEMKKLEAGHYVHQPLQDLCYGYLLEEELEAAQENGEQSLELALQLDDRLVVKNCLFLLAEVAVRQGDRFRGRRFLTELARYYPELAISEELIDVFMDIDLTRVVNLRG
ncbi:MAG: hypothetical protein GXP48_10900 [Acidobacteria bacterium]|nr:hypothetical protein [Acidobacteriota bacterium]